MLTALSASLEGWRRVLHSTAPEKLHGLLPGRHSRVSYILTAYLADAGLTWRTSMCLGVPRPKARGESSGAEAPRNRTKYFPRSAE